jgi:hypothetical protein
MILLLKEDLLSLNHPFWLIVYPVGAEEGSRVSCPGLPVGEGLYTDLRVFHTGIE